MKAWLGMALGAGFLLSGCGGDGGGSDEPAELSGVFQAGGITALHYVTPTRSGLTDANGTFKYLEGESVAFSVGGIELGHAPGAATISPFTLVGLTPPRTESELRRELDRATRVTSDFVRATNITRFLLALDVDHDPANGIDLRGRLASLANASLDFDQPISQFAVRLEKLTPDLTHNLPRWLPVMYLYRALGIAVPAHVPTHYDYVYYGSNIQGSMFSYYPDGSLKTQGTFGGFEGEDTYDTLFSYDALGRSVARKSGQFVSWSGNRIEDVVTQYDAGGNLESRIQETDAGADETIDFRTITEFDPDAYANIVGQTTRHDLDNDGVIDQIETMIAHFDSRLNQDGSIWELDSNVDGAIDSRVIMSSSYDDANRLTDYTYESDSQADGTVDSSDHSTVEYSPDGRRVVERYESDFDGDGTAESVQIQDWTLDARGRALALTVLSQSYSMTAQIDVKFDGDRRVVTEDSRNDWDGDGVFESLSHRSAHYDAIGNIQDAVIEMDDDADGAWDHRYVTHYEYGADGELKGYAQNSQWSLAPEPVITSTMSAVNVPLADGVLALAQRYLDYFDIGGAVAAF